MHTPRSLSVITTAAHLHLPQPYFLFASVFLFPGGDGSNYATAQPLPLPPLFRCAPSSYSSWNRMRTPTLALRHHHGCTLTPHPTPFFVARMFIWSFAFFFGIRCLAVAGQASGHKGFACGFSVRGSLSEHRRLDAKDAKGQRGPRTRAAHVRTR